MRQFHIVSKPLKRRIQAKLLAEKVKAKLTGEFGDSVNFENDQLTNLKFVINSKEMMLKYKNGHDFELYDRDAKTQKGETLGNYLSSNIFDSSDDTPDQIVSKVKEYV